MKDELQTAGCINCCVLFQGRPAENHGRQLQLSRCVYACKRMIEIMSTNGLSGVSPPRKFNSFSASQIRRIVWDPKFHYRIHKSTQLVHVLNQIDTIYTLPVYIFLRFILMLSSHLCLGRPSGLFTFIFSPKHYGFLFSHVVSTETRRFESQTGSGAHPAFCSVTGLLFSGFNRPWCEVNHPPTPSSAKLKGNWSCTSIGLIWIQTCHISSSLK
jgi:hypothetical protein